MFLVPSMAVNFKWNYKHRFPPHVPFVPAAKLLGKLIKVGRFDVFLLLLLCCAVEGWCCCFGSKIMPVWCSFKTQLPAAYVLQICTSDPGDSRERSWLLLLLLLILLLCFGSFMSWQWVCSRGCIEVLVVWEKASNTASRILAASFPCGLLNGAVFAFDGTCCGQR